MSNAKLLPSNSTLLERSIVEAGSVAGIDPDVIRTLWNADLCPSEFLPFLAWALSVDFWELADTDEQRRDLIKGAIQWHRKRGTPWAVKQALAAFGYPVLELVEYAAYFQQWIEAGGRVLDGGWTLDGAVILEPPVVTRNGQILRNTALNHWTHYALRLDATAAPWSREHQRKIRAVAESFAPERSLLVSLIIGLSMHFDSRITIKQATSRVRVKLTCCKRFQPAQRRTLDGCWKLGGGEIPLPLDGAWSLDGRLLDGRTLTGHALDNGNITFKHRVRIRLRMSMGGARPDPGTRLGGQLARLDGRWSLGETALQGWSLGDGVSLGAAQFDRIAVPRLDGSWSLGADVGIPGPWFAGVARFKHKGITTQESL